MPRGIKNKLDWKRINAEVLREITAGNVHEQKFIAGDTEYAYKKLGMLKLK